MDMIKYDLYRISGKTDMITFIKYIVNDRAFRKLVYFRKFQSAGKLGQIIIRFLNHFLTKKILIDLPFTVKIGRGLQMIHPYGIVFNSKTVIGDNCTILKGATLGNSKTGKIGSPLVGDNVYIGLNSTIVGGYLLEIMY